MTRVNGRWSQQPEAPMAMLLVVPGEELAAERQAVVVGRKPLRELGPVLKRLELAFREWVVVGYLRAAVRLDDAQGGQQLGHGLRSHRRPTIGVNRELALNNILFDARLADQPLGQLAAFLLRQRPAHHIAAEDGCWLR